ncbi:MAG: pyridoxal 5'-phosphate synthase glutaminase subunit PdxT [Thermoleophilia bacterium]|nr:pyridoxal 5'-phosphate synthase glutaminase subunit PdxT [Thermoleophilia bacterium]
MRPKIGVLALQGAFREHVRMLTRLGAVAREVRVPAELDGLDGLVIPGGESTTMGLLMEKGGLLAPLREFVKKHPVFGTCAGLIMLAKDTVDGEQPLLGVMDVTVRRNAFGRQTRSFEGSVELTLTPGASDTFHGVFIRAPWVETTGPGVEVIARCDGHVVGVRQGHMIGVAFHPELGNDVGLHAYFLEVVASVRA